MGRKGEKERRIWEREGKREERGGTERERKQVEREEEESGEEYLTVLFDEYNCVLGYSVANKKIQCCNFIKLTTTAQLNQLASLTQLNLPTSGLSCYPSIKQAFTSFPFILYLSGTIGDILYRWLQYCACPWYKAKPLCSDKPI